MSISAYSTRDLAITHPGRAIQPPRGHISTLSKKLSQPDLISSREGYKTDQTQLIRTVGRWSEAVKFNVRPGPSSRQQIVACPGAPDRKHRRNLSPLCYAR